MDMGIVSFEMCLWLRLLRKEPSMGGGDLWRESEQHFLTVGESG